MSNAQPKLNARQELFAQGLMVGKTEKQAYEDAGYRPNDSHANRLARNGRILVRLEELRKPVIEEAQVTLSGHLNDLKILRNMATKAGQLGAAITAEAHRGKAAGLYIERRINYLKRLDEMDGDELRHALGDIEREMDALGGCALAGTPPAGRA